MTFPPPQAPYGDALGAPEYDSGVSGAEIISQILRRLDELSTTTPVHWTRAEILVYVNEAINEFNLIAWEYQAEHLVSVNSANNVCNCPSAIIAASSVRGPRYLRRATVEDMDHECEWEAASAVRAIMKTWAPIGLNKFMVYPRPIVATTVCVAGLADPPLVTDSEDHIMVKPEWIGAIEDYCVERATFKEGPSELGQSGHLYQSFLDKANQAAGRNVIRSYPRFYKGEVNDESMRATIERGES